MQQFSLDVIGTHLKISVDTSSSCEEVFCAIRERLLAFELRFSRFIEGNWLSKLNKERKAILDDDAQKMLTFALELAKVSDGYFDPTVGSILSRLGYGVSEERGNMNRCDYRSIIIEGDRVTLKGDILLEFGGVGKGYLLDILKEMLDTYDTLLLNF
jgi:thiamine biosynthesis lipoprotein